MSIVEVEGQNDDDVDGCGPLSCGCDGGAVGNEGGRCSMRAGCQLAESGDGKVYIVVLARTREESVDCGWREAMA